MKNIDEKELLLSCQTGSEVAFKKLVHMYYKDAYAIALVRTHNQDAALNISQEAFIRIYKNIKSFDFNHPFKAWLYTIVKNLCINYWQRRRKKWTVFTDFFLKPSYPSVLITESTDSIDQEETKKIVWKGLNQLKPEDKDIILLKDFEDFSYKEISELLDIPLGTVMSRLFHARKKLAQILRKYQYVT
jgi:RNA polymerase sigma-70 factor (ECF subfamily)